MFVSPLAQRAATTFKNSLGIARPSGEIAPWANPIKILIWFLFQPLLKAIDRLATAYAEGILPPWPETTPQTRQDSAQQTRKTPKPARKTTQRHTSPKTAPLPAPRSPQTTALPRSPRPANHPQPAPTPNTPQPAPAPLINLTRRRTQNQAYPTPKTHAHFVTLSKQIPTPWPRPPTSGKLPPCPNPR